MISARSSITVILIALGSGFVGYRTAIVLAPSPLFVTEAPAIRLAEQLPYRDRFPQSIKTVPPEDNESSNTSESQSSRFTEWQTKARRQLMEDHVSWSGSDSSPQYIDLFMAAGLDQETASRLNADRIDLHRHAVSAGEALQDLYSQRLMFDIEARRLMSPEGYDDFRSYEANQAAVREIVNMREYANTQHGSDIPVAHADTIAALLRQFEATSTETWHGPYDPAPRPAIGPEAVIKRLESQISKIQDSYPAFLQAAADGGIPPEVIALLDSYYQNRIAQWNEEVAFAQRIRANTLSR